MLLEGGHSTLAQSSWLRMLIHQVRDQRVYGLLEYDKYAIKQRESMSHGTSLQW